MGLRLTPRDDGFFELFERAATLIGRAAAELTAILGAQDDKERKAIAKRLAEIESAADEITHDIVHKITTSFLTPFARGDLYTLAGALDECVDTMEAAADVIRLHRIDEFPPRMGRQVDVIARMADLTATAMPRLRNLRDLAPYCVDISRLENQADKNYRKLTAELFDTYAADPLTLMRYRLAADAFNATVSAFDQVAHTIEGIAVKET